MAKSKVRLGGRSLGHSWAALGASSDFVSSASSSVLFLLFRLCLRLVLLLLLLPFEKHFWPLLIALGLLLAPFWIHFGNFWDAFGSS